MINFAICSTSQNFTIFNLILWILAGFGIISILFWIIKTFSYLGSPADKSQLWSKN